EETNSASPEGPWQAGPAFLGLTQGRKGKLTVLKWRGGLQSTPKAVQVSPRRWQQNHRA
ncbi:hypothetical protein LEMLEM_LOCUS27717, partial [Lemmus lemmus]